MIGLAFLIMVIAVIALLALSSGQAPSFTFADWMNKLPGLIFQIALIAILITLLYFAWKFGNRYYQSWSHNQRRNRGQRRDQNIPMMPRPGRVNTNQLWQAFLLSQLGMIRRKPRRPRSDDDHFRFNF